MQTTTVDVAIIGAGTAGLSAKTSALKAGAERVLMIDPGPLGTTCARVGCMPSKLLIAAADAAHHGREAGLFGIRTTVEVDGKAVMARLQRERDRFVGGVLRSTDAAAAQGQLLSGRARFVAPGVLEVDGSQRIEARAVVIATGSAPWVPPPFRSLPASVALDNESLFALEDLPESVLVVGTGVIGLELGQALHRLGVRTTLVGVGGRVGPLSDPKLITEARALFGAELDLHDDYRLLSLEEVAGGVKIRFESAGVTHEGTYQRVLLAAGRRPVLEGLNLEASGIHLDARGRPQVDPFTAQAGDLPVFFAGDVTDDRPLLHEAADAGHTAGANAARYPAVLTGTRRTPLAVVFSDPNIAIVGEPWSSMHCDNSQVGEVDMGDQGRSRVMGINRGRIRIYGEAGTGRLRGAEMIAPRGEHLAHELAWAIQQRLTVTEALALPFYHPVVEEGLRTALRDLQAKLGISRPPGEPCGEFGPGT